MTKKIKGGSKPFHLNQPHPDDELLLGDFLAHYGTIKNLSEASKNKYRYGCKQILTWIKDEGKTLRSIDEATILKTIQKLCSSKWSENTREDNWERFTRVAKWAHKQQPLDLKAGELLFGEEKYRYKVNHNNVTKKGILTPTEILKVLSCEPNLCYKAFYSVLYESGTRRGEIFSLRKCDVSENNNGCMYIDLQLSKTERRKVPLVKLSTKYLRQWLKSHPGDDESPLWLNTYGQKLDPFTANKHLKYLLGQAGIKTKKVSLHSFRHSRATELAQKGLTEFQMCKFFGWKLGSSMPKTYIREQQIDVEHRLLEAEGIVEQHKPKPIGKSCLQCENINSLDSEYCELCNMPLDRERLDNLKASVDIEHMQELLKQSVIEAKADLIAEIRAEIHKTD